jgi:chemotaxis protein histidine kinase CheA/CheY-like chemotaxis protein
VIDNELLAIFLPEARQHLAQLAVAGDRKARLEAAHGLRGACSMVGLTQLAEEATRLEEALRAGSDGAPERERIARALDSLATGTPAGAVAPEAPDWDPDELRGLRAFFLDEALEHLEAIDGALQALERGDGGREALGTLMRKLHTFKGSAGSVQLSDLARASHALEDQVVALRDAGRPLQPDELRAMENGAEQLRALLRIVERDVRGAHSEDERREKPDRRLTDRRAASFVGPDAQTVRVEVQRIDELMDAASELVFDRTRIARRLQELEGCVRDMNKVRGALTELEHRDAPPDRARLGEIATELGDVLGSLRRAVEGAGTDAEGLGRTSTTLQEHIRRVRMMAIGRLFGRLEAPVRELARREGKQLRFITAGEETEIDKAVVERIAEPLLHLVRNAVAHGIEPPDARARASKPPAGTLTLSARHEGDAVEIQVADDGQGIDVEAVRKTVATARRLTADETAGLDEKSLFDALFEPGVSTRVGADELAGRGVGLDAVREAIARLGGQVRVSSEAGRGATFTVRLPLTTAVQQALLFKVGGQVYAVPAARVSEALQIGVEDIRTSPGGDSLVLPSGTLPLVRLGALLGVPAPPGTSRRAALLITPPEGATFAMTCDKVIGPREIVVRSLGPLLASLRLYAGATISGAGKVQLILDVAHLAEHAARGVHAVRPTRALGPRRVLVADDSRSIREAAALILQQGGYSVETVPDGWDAWELLQDRPFDVLLTDLEMPRLDGHELIARIRRTPELEGLPVVVVSSRTADTVRDRVLGAGAAGFVPKPLRRKALLDAIEAATSGRR